MATTASFPWPFAGAGTELRLLFENAPVGIAQCDRQGTILAMNPALSAMLGDKLQTLDHPRFRDLLPPEDRDRSDGMFRQWISGERENFQIEKRLNTSGGASACLRWTAWKVRDNAHNPDCVLLLAEDIPVSGNQGHEGPAERWQALGRMAGSIAHDFNNVLTGILLYCDLMTDCLKTDGLNAGGLSSEGFSERKRLRNYAEEIHSAGIQATGMVQQLLTVTRPRNPNPHPLSLNSIVEEMRNLLLRLMGENIELSFHLDPNLGLVAMDSAQAQQVLLNLVLNARDAMPGGGRIDVETGNCNLQIFPGGAGDGAASQGGFAAIPCVLFVVSDNGSGMDEETRQRAFQACFTTKEEGRGSGLGLATVYSIVAGRGGLVQVDSTLGRGTRVTVLLPCICSPAPMQYLPRAV